MADVVINKFTTQILRDGATPSSPGFVVSEGQDPVNPPGTNNFVPYSGAISNVELGEYGLESGFITLDTTPTGTPTDQGTIYWDDSKSTAALIMNGTTQHIGQDTYFYVKNSSGSNIAKGVAVRFDGTDGASGHLLIAPFLADGTYPSAYFMGVTAEAIDNGEFGQVTNFGEIEGIDTSIYSAGDLLYASTTSAGAFQTTAPIAPNNIVLIAAAVNSKNNGTIIVRPTYGSNINDDEGVKIVSPTTGDLLQLQAGGLWENKTKAQVLGGTSSQFVKGDGSLDSTSYQPLLTNPVTGTGSAGQVAYWSSGSAITGESNLFWDSTNDRLGIGTATPSSKLNVLYNGGNGVRIQNTSITSGEQSSLQLRVYNGTGGGYFSVNSSGSPYHVYLGSSQANTDLIFEPSGVEQMRITSDGDVGIGTSTPLSRLEVRNSDSDTVSGILTISQRNAAGNNDARLSISCDAANNLVNLKSTGTNSGGFSFIGGNTELMQLTPSGQLLVGVDSGDPFNASSLIRAQGTTTYLQLKSSTTSAAGILLGDTDDDFTGGMIYNNQNDYLWLQSGNAEVMRIWGSTGNVNIGPTPASDSGFKLDVNGTGRFVNGVNMATTSGNVGIGVTPSYKLQILDSTPNGRAIQGVNNATSGTNYGAVIVAEGIGATKNIGLYASAEGASTNVAAVFDKGNVGIGTSDPQSQLHLSSTTPIMSFTDSNSFTDPLDRFIIRASENQGNVQWYDDSAATTLNIMTFRESGNVGIGTNEPIAKLAVEGEAYFANDIFLRDGATASGDILVRIYDSSDDGIIDVYRNNEVVNRIHGNGSSYLNAGNVLIGTTTNGASKLRISGLPTSSAGLSSGDVWNSSGTLKIV